MIHFEIVFGIPQSGFFPIASVVQSLSHIQLLHFHEWQHTRLLCLSMSPGVCSNSCSLGQWHHPTISSSVIPFSSCFQSFPASCSFQMSQLFVLGGQSIWSCSFGISPANEYSGLISFKIYWFHLRWFDLLAVQETLESFQIPQFKIISSSTSSLLYGPALTYIRNYWKHHSFDYMDLCQQRAISAF